MSVHHGHAHDESTTDRRLWASVGLNVAITAGEVVAGLAAGSLALLADALHNLSDVAALLMAIGARILGRRPPSARHTFGLKRAEVLAAIVNAVVLLAVTGFIAREAVHRLMAPQPVRGGIMLGAALAAFAANIFSVFLLRRHDHRDLNVRSAFLHLLQDALASLAVVAAALLAGTKAGPYMDPVASLAVGLVVVHSALSIVWESLSIVFEAVPRGIDLEQLVDGVDARFAPARLHHVHVWEVGPGQRMLTAHVSVPTADLGEAERLFAGIREHLREAWSIEHVTLEPERNGCSDGDPCGVP